MDEVQVRLQDGRVRRYPQGTPLAQVAADVGREDALVARVDGRLVDLAAALEGDAAVEFVGFDDPEGRMVYWHSSAHLLAQAVKQLFPQARLAIGPPIDDGFYYDIDIGRPLTAEDLERIEARMRQLAAADQPIQRVEIPRDEAIHLYREMGERFKLELLEEIPDARVSFYRQDGFLDMCRGPHLPSTGRIKAIKLLSVSGAYWRGDEHQPMLQRIYGITFPEASQLEAHLRQLEEARRRDHRRLGRELQLFAFAEEVGQGLPLWLPRGAVVRRILERYIVDLETELGYHHVYTPDLAEVGLYKISGHWEHFRENMYPPMEIDHEELVLKPMNCPHHIMIYKHQQRSYRDLPVRIAELGRMYRYERSGTLVGLHRVRSMTLNDAHIFCRQDQIKEEFAAVVRLIQRVYRDLRVQAHRYDLSLHDPANRAYYHQDEELWALAEGLLRDVLDDLELAYTPVVGGANFYGPKLDVQIRTATGAVETLSTVQLDFLLPRRFGLEYIGEDGRPHVPVMIHRAIISTMERMIAFLIEAYAGAFPLWLAPEQVRVLPITDRQVSYARQVGERLRTAGVRVEVDASNERIAYKIRQAQVMKVPYMLVVGEREVSSARVAVRRRDGEDLGPMTVDAFLQRLQQEVAAKA
ncbi:MAG: threonine--tRNA ligase [Armatimonadota bacterium]|nr:threonine--tRNA ligase [Armatimonadota bacterium]MDR7465450.1 threonine--tRNA ligase [Armatimonadota bacterium]MDR7469869.1 threonine--tRNA ligase [Armatimonadota bacterium]MDR7474329.1 threonine--tRNA ligase [Armatimonadota bacterium]MDR7539904.1 threonine--tRNA ligase [Armatimonadota bacterium]